jgi:hypothetical protein
MRELAELRPRPDRWTLTGSTGINPKIELVDDRRFLNFVCKHESCQVWFRG